MAKIVFAILLSCTLFCSAAPVDAGVLRTCAVEFALGENGVQELTGNNDGVRVEQYLAAVGLSKGAYYCAAFISFVFQHCGITNPRTGWSPSWFPSSRVIWDRKKPETVTPQPGDVGGIYFPKLKRIAHVFIIVKWGREVTTIEANTNVAGNSRNGGGVHKKYRDKSVIDKVSSWIR